MTAAWPLRHLLHSCYCHSHVVPAGPWKHLLDVSQEFKFSVEADATRSTASERATSVKAVAERIRADRLNAASLAATGTLGLAGSIGGFSSQGLSLGAKISASQYSLGECCI